MLYKTEIKNHAVTTFEKVVHFMREWEQNLVRIGLFWRKLQLKIRWSQVRGPEHSCR